MALKLFEAVEVLRHGLLDQCRAAELEDLHRVREAVVEVQREPDSSQLETRTIPFFPGLFLVQTTHGGDKYTCLTPKATPRLAPLAERIESSSVVDLPRGRAGAYGETKK